MCCRLMHGGDLSESSLGSLSTVGMKPYDIAVDHYSRLMFWSCSGHDVINITRLDYGGSFGSPGHPGHPAGGMGPEGQDNEVITEGGYMFSNVYDDRIIEEFDYQVCLLWCNFLCSFAF